MRHRETGGEGSGSGDRGAIFLFDADPVFPGLGIPVKGENFFAGDGFAPRKPQSRIDFTCFRLVLDAVECGHQVRGRQTRDQSYEYQDDDDFQQSESMLIPQFS